MNTPVFDLLAMERELCEGYAVIAGMDEVGRGPLCGPVVAACVIMDYERVVDGVNDSKRLSEKRREILYPQIIDSAAAFGIGVVEPDVIDEMNILNATKLAFKLALDDMGAKPQLLLIDGRDIIEAKTVVKSVIKGDAKCYSIAAASIIAKVTRDRLMIEYAAQYPGYGLERNKGYGTAEHIAALRERGPTPIHRRSFIKKLI